MKIRKLILAGLLIAGCIQAAEKPNFIIIMTDDMRVGQFAPMAEELSENDFAYRYSLDLPPPNYWERPKWMELIYSVQP